MSRTVVVRGCRTPFVRAGTSLADLDVRDLGRTAVRELLERTELDPADIDQVIIGNVARPTRYHNLAREIVLAAGLPTSIPAYTVSEACVSGCQAITNAADLIDRGYADVVVAGGVESLSNVPLEMSSRFSKSLMSAKQARSLSQRVNTLAHIHPRDLVPVPMAVAETSTGLTMGQSAEIMAQKNAISRQQQDALALLSHQRAAVDTDSGWLAEDLVPVYLNGRAVSADGHIRRDTSMEKLAKLPPVFDRKDGTITAGNSSPLTDGASAVLLTSEDQARAMGLRELVVIRSYAYAAVDPADQLLLGPAFAIPKALQRAELSLADIEVVEMHEAFAAQVLSTTKLLKSDEFARRRLGLDQAPGDITQRDHEPLRWLNSAGPPLWRHWRTHSQHADAPARSKAGPLRPGECVRRGRHWLRYRAGTPRVMSSSLAAQPYIRLEILAPNLAELVLDQPGSQVNMITQSFVEELNACLAEIERTPTIHGLIVKSAKPGQFFAGADLEFVRQATTADQLRSFALAFQQLMNRLAGLQATTVAAISGPAIGGGLELAMACDYRVCIDRGSAELGCPEVNLGLLPAGGGTQRIPRLVGLASGLDLVLTGKRLSPRRALKAGLVDEVVAESALWPAAHRVAHQSKPHRRPASLQERFVNQTPPGRAMAFRKAREMVQETAHGHYPAPVKALECIETGWMKGLEAGFQAEVDGFAELASGPVAHNLINLFFLTQGARKDPPAPAAAPVRKIGIVGAGFMGSGIAEVAATRGLDVRLRDVDQPSVMRGLATVNSLLDGAAKSGRWSRNEVDTMRARTTGTTTYDGFSSANLIIEAVFEELELKRRVLAEIEDHAEDATVIASNTSTIPIGLIAAHARLANRVVGMHFFSPVHRMQLVEVIRPQEAEDWAVDTAVATGRRLGKTVIVVKDGPGFYTSRVVGQMLAEAGRLFMEGSNPTDIDAAMVNFGFPVGPMALFDEVGLAVAGHVGEVLAEHLPSLFEASPVVGKLLAAGRPGKRGGRGFYAYIKGKRQNDTEPGHNLPRAATSACCP